MSIPTPPPTSFSTPSPTERNTYLEEAETYSSSSSSMATKKAISPPIYIIVATSTSPPLGIGFRNSLPWGPIRSDMSFFVKATTTTINASHTSSESSDKGKNHAFNAVIMGRKTWDSIPSRYRPLSGRLNVVITRSETKILASKIVEDLKARKSAAEEDDLVVEVKEINDARFTPDGTDTDTSTRQRSSNIFISSSYTDPNQLRSQILVSNSLASSLFILASPGPTDIVAPSVFCIGGAEIYRQILSLKTPGIQLRVLQTQIRKQDGTAFSCDTFFPEDLHDSDRWKGVDAETVKGWIGVDLPQSDGSWKRDEKSHTEIRVLGWQRTV